MVNPMLKSTNKPFVNIYKGLMDHRFAIKPFQGTPKSSILIGFSMK